ncbi:MAG: DUF4956 domain-containing protein [Clostridia bacterium]|nr:DUF4956 domain-containing protein [Clostridia bacterium]NLS84414.1 DUF4956 domain-containing protein [Oscillospiraceae bacterium]
MKNMILNLLETQQPISFRDIMLRLAASVIIGAVLYISYWLSHSGTVYSKKFNVSLIMLTVLTATVMIVIGNNVALSLGMVGALSIVRYRTAVKDSRDTAYIFWAIIGGICCGAGDYLTAICGSAVIFALLLILGRVKNDNRCLLIIRSERVIERKIETVVFDTFGKKAILKVKNSTPDDVEFIYDIPKNLYEKQSGSENNLLDRIYALGKIECINIVEQTDDIA